MGMQFRIDLPASHIEDPFPGIFHLTGIEDGDR
jgi:hypothetical protein